MDDLIERIEDARNDADYWFGEGDADKATVTLSREDCTAIAEFLTKAFGCVLMGKQDSAVADTLAILGGAFAGEQEDTADDEE